MAKTRVYPPKSGPKPEKAVFEEFNRGFSPRPQKRPKKRPESQKSPILGQINRGFSPQAQKGAENGGNPQKPQNGQNRPQNSGEIHENAKNGFSRLETLD